MVNAIWRGYTTSLLMTLMHKAILRLNRYLATLAMEWRMKFGKTELQLVKEYPEAAERYHIWYYYGDVSRKVRFLGRPATKSVSDLWNYQEILYDLRPNLVVEFGTQAGGSALYFKTVMSQISQSFRVLTVDVDHSLVDADLRRERSIEFMTCSSTEPQVAQRIIELRRQYAGPAFFILDSDHRVHHVFAELQLLRDVTRPGDYVIVEDSNINGHPVVPEWGPGPYEAVQQYFAQHPDDYMRDEARERKFGFTFAPGGFLIRR